MPKIREGMKLDFYKSVGQAAVLAALFGGFGVHELVLAHDARQDISLRNPSTEIPKLAETFRASCLEETTRADTAMSQALNELKTLGKPVTVTLTANPAAVSDCARSKAEQSYASEQSNVADNANFLDTIGSIMAVVGFAGLPLAAWSDAKRNYLQPSRPS